MTLSGYTPVEHPGFGGGLNLRDGVDAVEGAYAIDSLNVEHTVRGTVRSRGGTERLLSITPGQHTLLFEHHIPGGESHMIVDFASEVWVINKVGGVVSTVSLGSSGDFSACSFGRFGEHNTWVANGEDQLFFFPGAAGPWAGPSINFIDVNDVVTPLAAAPKPRCVVATADNRLLACGFQDPVGGPGGSPGDLSTVYSCEPGNWQNWREDDFFRLGPGDGDEIMGGCSWRELTFIFKRHSFFVYTGSSIDGQGGALFHRRPVQAGIGLGARNACCVGRDAVYFIGGRGIYATDGGEPVLLSDLVEPIFRGGSSDYFEGGEARGGITPAALTGASIAWHDDRLYVGYPREGSTVNDRTLVLDLLTGAWGLWDTPCQALGVYQGDLHMIGPGKDGGTGIYRHNKDIYGDAVTGLAPYGYPYTARWRSGWQSYGGSEVHVVRESKAWGKGNVTLKRAVDFEDYRREKAVKFGAVVAPKLVRLGIRGTVHSFGFEGEVGGDPVIKPGWAIHRLVHHLLAPEPATSTGRDA